MSKKLPSLNFSAAALKSTLRMAGISLVFVFVTVLSHAQAKLVKDLNRIEQVTGLEYSEFLAGKGVFYFISQKKELWKSNGTTSGTVRIKTLASISTLTWTGSTLYFVGDDGTGPELWKYNGSVVTRVKDIRPGALGSNPDHLTDVNGTLYFAANDGKSGIELWKSDGTNAGTVLVKDIFQGGGNGNPKSLSNVNGTLYFSGYNNVHGAELWKSNGSAAGTVMVKDVNAGSNGSNPSSIISFGGAIYFVAHERSTGRELWKSDGTAAGTKLLKDLDAGSASSHAYSLTVMGNAFYFAAATNRTALWKSNGTTEGTVIVKGPEDMTADYGITSLTAINGYLYYIAGFDDTQYFWKSDGTEAGTGAIIEADYYDAHDPNFTLLNGKIYFFRTFYDAEDQSNQQLYQMNPDGTGVSLVWESSYPFAHDDYLQTNSPDLITVNNALFFWGKNNENEGFKLFKSDGTPQGTTVLKDAYKITKSANPVNFVNVNNVVYFRTIREWVDRSEYVWRTDGTSGGTILLKKMDKVHEIVSVGNTVFFSGFIDNKWELWKTNGTKSGTLLLKSFDYLADDDNFYWFAPMVDVNGILFFYNEMGELWKSDGTTTGTTLVKDFPAVMQVAPSPTHAYVLVGTSAGGQELWKTNGTPSGTVKIKNIGAGSGRNEYQRFPTAFMNNIFYFIGNDGVHGFELWRSNGTASGTYIVTDLRTGDNDEYYTDIWRMIVFNGSLYLSGSYDENLYALYKSNGTAGGTQKLININAVQGFIPNGDQLLFIPENKNNALQEVWATDGTEAGTQLVKRLDNTDLAYNITYEVVNEAIYFTTARNSKLWRTDGTACGTFSVPLNITDVSPIEKIENTLIMGGHSPIYGKELYRYDLSNAPASPCGQSVAARSASPGVDGLLMSSEEETVTSAPNPFHNTFAIRINSDHGSVARLTVFNSTGKEIESVEQIPSNTSYAFGQTWSPGLYIVKIEVDGKLVSKKIIKK